MPCQRTVNCKNCKIRGKEGVDEKKASSEEIPVALLFFEHGSDDSDNDSDGDGFIFRTRIGRIRRIFMRQDIRAIRVQKSEKLDYLYFLPQ